MDYIRKFAHDTPEYMRLDIAAKMLTDRSTHGTVYTVEETYFDFGQDWVWTTLIANATDGSSWQALSPRNQEALLTADTTIDGVDAVMRSDSWNRYCVDRH